jgi:hypothetical protein
MKRLPGFRFDARTGERGALRQEESMATLKRNAKGDDRSSRL